MQKEPGMSLLLVNAQIGLTDARFREENRNFVAALQEAQEKMAVNEQDERNLIVPAPVALQMQKDDLQVLHRRIWLQFNVVLISA